MASCARCGKSYIHQSSLTRHFQSKHCSISPGGSTATRTRYCCRLCFTQFSRADALKRHERGHAGIGRRQCSICSRSMRKDSVRDHERRCIKKILKRPEKYVVHGDLHVRNPEDQQQESKMQLEWPADVAAGVDDSHVPVSATMHVELRVIQQKGPISKKTLIPLLRGVLLNCFYNRERYGIWVLDQRLQQLGLSFADLDSRQDRLLHLACLFFDDDMGIAELMLKGGIDIDARDALGLTAVHTVSDNFEAKALQFLIDRNASLGLLADRIELEFDHKPTLHNATALAIASHAASDEGARCILKTKSNIDITATVSALLGPLMVMNESSSLAKALPHSVVGPIQTLLRSAIAVDRFDVVQSMRDAISAGMHIDCLQNERDKSLFFTALKAKSQPTAELLLGVGANVRPKYNRASSAVQFATEKGDVSNTSKPYLPDLVPWLIM